MLMMKFANSTHEIPSKYRSNSISKIHRHANSQSSSNYRKMQYILTVLIGLVYCLCCRTHGAPQSWSQVVQKSASDLGVYKPSTNYANHHRHIDRRTSFQGNSLGECRNDYNFHYILMNLQWAPGYCRTSPKACVKMEKKHFTIHGMWPNLRDSNGPSFCCFDNTFNLKELQPIMSELNEYWPSLFSRDNTGFWSHEWLKHGTCAKNAPNLRGELSYFNSTLNLLKSMPIMETLKAASIVPSMTKVYQANDVQNVLRQVHKASRVQIDCDLEHDSRIPVLTGINFCFDTSMNPIDCSPSKSRCSREVRFLG